MHYTLRSQVNPSGQTRVSLSGQTLHTGSHRPTRCHFTGLLAYLAPFYRAACLPGSILQGRLVLPGGILQGHLLTWHHFTGLLAYLAVFSRAASLPGGIFQGCLLTWQYFTGPLAYLAVFCTLWRDAIRSAGYSWGSERTQRFH